MKNIMFAVLLMVALPVLSEDDKKMLNSNPSPVTEPTAEHHMQNRNPNPVEKPAHEMKNISSKKGVHDPKSPETGIDIQHYKN